MVGEQDQLWEYVQCKGSRINDRGAEAIIGQQRYLNRGAETKVRNRRNGIENGEMVVEQGHFFGEKEQWYGNSSKDCLPGLVVAPGGTFPWAPGHTASLGCSEGPP